MGAKTDNFYKLIFQELLYKEKFNPTDAHISDVLLDIISVNVDAKADKVEGAVNNNFASLDAEGNLKDSLKNAGSFAGISHHHDTRYIRLDANINYDSTSHQITFQIDNCLPFSLDITGDPMPALTGFNADMLDGKHASAFSLLSHDHNTIYPLKAGAESITGLWTFHTETSVPFAVHADNNSIVTNLNADLLDDLEAADFALVGHTHAWGDITGTLSYQTDLQSALDDKIDKPAEEAADGGILVWDILTETVKTTAVDLSDLATVTDVAAKATKVSDATANNLAKLVVSSGILYDIADSGKSTADFADAVHEHDSRYFTKTELTDYSTQIAISQESKIEGETYYIVGSPATTGATTTANGTVAIRINGTTYNVLTAAAA